MSESEKYEIILPDGDAAVIKFSGDKIDCIWVQGKQVICTLNYARKYLKRVEEDKVCTCGGIGGHPKCDFCMGVCDYCGLSTMIRNPSGNCDHLYYPENVNKNYRKGPEICQKCNVLKLTIELNDNQIRALLTSLELFERCAMGDFDQIAEAIGWKQRHKFVESGLEKILQWFFYEGRKFGIAQCPVEDAKIAYEIMYEIRHKMCTSDSSCYHWPIHKVTKEPQPKVEVKNG